MPLTDKDVLAALSELIDPVTGRNYVESKSVKNVKVEGERGNALFSYSGKGQPGDSITDQDMIDHLARCRAVVFPPFNEDYGFVTVEAFMCGKPVITCTDSGGPAELVRDGESGFVTAPSPEGLAVAMRTLMDDRRLAERMGEAGAAIARSMTWSAAISQLLR